MIVYSATNKVNNKSYIGQTGYTLEFRRKVHLDNSKSGRDNLYFYNAIRKYGEDNFVWQVLCKCSTKQELVKMEMYYIRYYSTVIPNGYNLTFGGEGNLGWKPSEETRLKWSKMNKGRNKGKTWEEMYGEEKAKKMKEHCSKVFSGRVISEEQKQKLSVVNKGKKLSVETKRRIGDSVRGQKRTRETKEKMSKNQLGKKNSFYGKHHNLETIRNKMSHYGKNNPFFGKIFTEEQLEKKSRFLYKVISVSGETKFVKVLSLWCENNNIDYSKIGYYINKDKFYEGYKIVRVEPSSK